AGLAAGAAADLALSQLEIDPRILTVIDVGRTALALGVMRGLCFAEGTPVWTEDGLRPIEDVQPGEFVWAYDFESKQWKLCAVSETYANNYRGDMVEVTIADDDGRYETITATAGHPFWVVADGADRASRPTVT